MKDNIDKKLLEVLQDIAEEEKKDKEMFDKAFSYYQKHSLFPFETIKDSEMLDFEYGTYSHIGYCTIKKIDYKNCFYPKNDFYVITQIYGNKDIKEISTHKFMMQNDDIKEGFHNLVWQTCGYCEDDYSGYLLFPLNDGRYWLISFNNV